MKKFLFALMVGAVALASCNDIEQVDCPTCGGGVEQKPDDVLVVYPFIEGKDMILRNWRDGNTIGLWLTDGHISDPYLSSHSSYSNVKARFFSDTWFINREVKLTDEPACIYACSPYIPDSDPSAIPVETKSGTDYMYGTHVSNQQHVYAGHNEALLLMKHALSMVQVYIAKKEDIQPIKVSSIEIRPVGMNESMNPKEMLPIGATMNIETGVLTHTDWGKYSQKVKDWTLGNEFADTARRDFLVIPQRIARNQVELSVVIGGVEYTKILNHNQWSRAYRYAYRILFTGTELELLNVDIAPWETTGDIIIDIVG